MESKTETQQNIEKFLTPFNLDKEHIIKGLAEAPNIPSSEVAKHLDSLYETLQKLKKLLSENTIILPSYEIAQAQKTIDQLEQQIASSRLKLVPKKKFSFKSKTTSESKPKKEEPQIPKQDSNGSSSSLLKELSTSVSQDEVTLLNLSDQTIYLHQRKDSNEVLNAVRIHNLKNCNVFTGAVRFAIYIEQCENCNFYLASQQLRIHTCKDSNFYIFTKSNPIIEHCDSLRFAPYSFKFPDRDEQFQKAGFDLNKNLWNQVQDFTWIKGSEKPSPHWTILPQSEIKEVELTS